MTEIERRSHPVLDESRSRTGRAWPTMTLAVRQIFNWFDPDQPIRFLVRGMQRVKPRARADADAV